jgi:putative acetyltransferase
MPHASFLQVKAARIPFSLTATVSGDVPQRMDDKKDKPHVYLVGRQHGPPTFEDIIALTKALSGRDPTPDELKEAREVYESGVLEKPENLKVRELRADEDVTFRQIHHAAVHGLAAGHYTQAILDKWSAPIRDGEQAQPRREGQIRLIAELDGQPVGIGALFPDKSELDAVYVLPSAARTGVGTALVREIERIAVERGVTRLHLDASVNAEPFYLAMGYAVVERGEHVLNSGQRMACVRMAKDLDIEHRL